MGGAGTSPGQRLFSPGRVRELRSGARGLGLPVECVDRKRASEGLRNNLFFKNNLSSQQYWQVSQLSLKATIATTAHFDGGVHSLAGTGTALSTSPTEEPHKYVRIHYSSAW